MYMETWRHSQAALPRQLIVVLPLALRQPPNGVAPCILCMIRRTVMYVECILNACGMYDM